ncbi:cilia- and flagella-associated protein 418 [Myripristis murdjan]|uniref:Cilia- and flagella-associated protein 418 n=1 Tax=Myripristis murdjan TaxID=586833 RepID=A0A667Y5M5_9TELE|nr:protein C8orf37 homolog [Myripristis murdjan]
MEDDLDELLDEVEQKFCRGGCGSSSALRGSESRREARGAEETAEERKVRVTTSEQHRGSDTEDIDALLDELLEEDYSDSPPLKSEQLPKGPKAVKTPAAPSGGRKCCPVFLGGSATTNGVGTALSNRSCDQLRCTSCDFRVLMFDDYEWDSSCDYLFLRNNMPDSQKLRAKLKRRRGLRAYACQCSWFSARELADLKQQPQLRWVCGKHQS